MVSKRENRIQVMMSDDERDAINEWRHKCRIATLSEAIRRLAKTALVLDGHNEADKQKWLASLSAEKTTAAGTAVGSPCSKCGRPLDVTSFFLGFGPDKGTYHLQCLPAPLPSMQEQREGR